MVQVRKLVLAIAAASALSSGMAHALGLGELTLKSTLNQPLVAEIELLDVKDLTVAEVVPSLASADDFAKAGVDRQAFLNDLTFTPVLNANGKSILRVTSSQPLSEPMVKFLVQVMWPNGRLLRDYSVLLDPSKFSPQTAEAAGQAAPAINAPVTGATAQHTTVARDTLWEIAAKARNGGSIQQTMLAIQALNPDAFIDGNINRLKAGQVLRLPDATQITQLPQTQAIAEVAAQNKAWRQGRRYVPRTQAQQLDATGRAPDAAAAQGAARDSLSLVSAESGKNTGKGAVGDSKGISNKLAVTQESLDTTRRDNAELKSRVADLQSQMDKLQRLIELKNNQLAKLQAEGGATPEAVASETLPAESVPATAPAATDAVPTATPGETPAKATPEQTYNELLTSPLLMGLIGGGAIVLALLLLLLARRRKAQQEAEKHVRMARALAEESDFNEDLDLPESSFEGLEEPAPTAKLATAPTPAPVVAAVVTPVVMTTPIAAPLVAPAGERADDVLGHAQAHIDEGRLNQAASLLEEGIKQEPQRSELRLKLMEVHGMQGDRDAFVVQERQLVANGKNFAQVEELKSRFPAMAAVAAVGGIAAAAVAAELDAQYVKDLLLDEPQEPAPSAEEPALDDDFDSAFDLDLDAPQAAPPVEPAAAVTALEDDFDSAFDLDLDQPEEPVAAPVAPAEVALDDDLDAAFDLSLDELEAVSPAVVATEPVADLEDFPLDDDLSFESPAEAPQSPADLADFDLDLAGDVPESVLAEDAAVLGLDDEPQDLAVSEEPAVAEVTPDDLELPADFDLSLADEMDAPATSDDFITDLDDVHAELDRFAEDLEHPPIGEPSFTAEDAALAMDNDEPEFDFLSGTDEVATKLDLAQAYIDMGDKDGARDILGEVLSEGNDGQKGEAKEMLARLV
ncbi:peptidoglycan-binding protein [Pseudomonas sp. S04]|uniref:FimV/HubP family polar landmark protein n=1 Tax=unclassified Pseudomonas TaxID=196821 RepID=UPI00131FCB43|nr:MULTISPECIES: FimV/HubP family polar landmark protein [unclassified Pseudomonas]QHD02133.1 peptidoglycan-binding protein [Pseudomonas sp. S04]QHF34616.1 peptidoglycan-binding protein [Pseudomonas sp. S19]